MVGWHHRFNGHELGQTLGDPGTWQSMGSRRVGHDLVTEQQALLSGAEVDSKSSEKSDFLKSGPT